MLCSMSKAAAFLPLVLAWVACGSGESVSNDPPVPSCPSLERDQLVPPAEPPDGASACPAGDCNYQTQEGCSDDQACRPQFNASEPDVTPGCEGAGEGEPGDACSAQSDCGRGLYCAAGFCRRLCCGGDWSACDEGESCIRSLSVKAGGEVIPAGVDLCFPVGTCDPLDPESCADEPGRECKIVDPTGAVACAPQSDKEVGDACGPPDVCKQGLSCVGGVCVKLCRFLECGEPACGPEDGTCVHFLRDPEGIGECTLGR